MSRSAHTRSALLSLAAAGLAALLIWLFIAGRREAAMERERERPIKTPSRVTIENGVAVVHLDRAARDRTDLRVVALDGGSEGREISAYGTVVSLQPLADLAVAYTAAKARAETGRATLAASRRTNERIAHLLGQSRDVSSRDLEAARARLRLDEASAAAAASEERTLAARATEEWGPVIARWVTDGSPDLTRLLEREEVLVQVTLPPDVSVPGPPKSAFLTPGGGPRVAARLVSRAARTDPRIQGESFFYAAPGSSGLLQGMNVEAFFAPAPGVSGTVVPGDAVVWSRGKAWAYVQTGPETFARREVPTDKPTGEGGYEASSFPSGTRVVVSGAQQLLSEEFRVQMQVGEGEQK